MCQEQRILDLEVEFHKWEDELRNERSANEPGGNRWKRKAQMIRGTSSAGVDIYEPAKVLLFGYMEKIVRNRDDLVECVVRL